MAGRLVTIATFDQAGQAHIAKNALEAAGLRAVLTDEAIVAMDWLLSNAVGGIKVQVLEEDADRAVSVLEESLGSDGPGEPLDDEAMAAEAEAAGAEDDEPPPPATEPEPPDDAAELSERDEYARRLVWAGFFGIIVPLLWFYAIYLFLNATFGPGPLSERGRRNRFFGGSMLALGFFTALYLIWLYRDPFP